MNHDQYLLLLNKFLAGDATPEEVDLIVLFRDKFEKPKLNAGNGDHDEYLLLFEKFLAGNATPGEVDTIMGYRDKFELAELNADDKDDNPVSDEQNNFDKFCSLSHPSGHSGRYHPVSGVVQGHCAGKEHDRKNEGRDVVLHQLPNPLRIHDLCRFRE